MDGSVATCKKTSRWCPTHPHRLQIICPKQPAVWFSDINQANTVIPLGQTQQSFQTSTNNLKKLSKLHNYRKSALSLSFNSRQCNSNNCSILWDSESAEMFPSFSFRYWRTCLSVQDSRHLGCGGRPEFIFRPLRGLLSPPALLKPQWGGGGDQRMIAQPC